ncbi:MAG TPA: metallophosphoesterase family protein [Candidatus Methylomirabilis sp.]|nr:metallophosphoesterase family protein [Candidatus Methylomirabilis sp.]
MRRLGLISDTHGLLREEALRTLRGSDLILHAGDVGDPTILERLRELAPVVAVRGNVDTGEWAQALRWVETVEISGTTIYMRHILQDLDLDPLAAGFAMVISGHSHKHGQTLKDGILYINPGSAGPKRFQLPVTVAMLDLLAKPWKTEFLELDT